MSKASNPSRSKVSIGLIVKNFSTGGAIWGIRLYEIPERRKEKKKEEKKKREKNRKEKGRIEI